MVTSTLSSGDLNKRGPGRPASEVDSASVLPVDERDAFAGYDIVQSDAASRRLCPRDVGSRLRAESTLVQPITFVRHAESLKTAHVSETEWQLTDKGRNDAQILGELLRRSIVPTLVWTSPERRARNTVALAFPSEVAGIRVELSEVRKPWYASTDDHAAALASFLRRDAVTGWERHENVIARIKRLTQSFRASDRPLIVGHGVFLTTWLDHDIGLDDPVSFWSNLRLPDAWELDLQEKSFRRIS
jgi:broad specificity phosphatase PhoE